MIGATGLLLLGLLQGGPMETGTAAGRPLPPHRERAADPAPGLARIRALYLAAVEDEEAIERGLEEIARLRAGAAAPLPPAREATLTAYEGALVTLRAKHALWPPARLRHLREGLELLDAQVAAHPDAAEIRYLRLMSCYYLPAVLGRARSVREDFAALARLLPAGRGDYPAEAYRAVVGFVLRNGRLAPEQRAPLERLLEADDG